MAITLVVIAVTANTATMPIPVAIARQVLTGVDSGSWYKQVFCQLIATLSAIQLL